MTDTSLKVLLPEVVMESFYDMRNAQPAKDRLHYFDVVLEGNVETNATLLQKLYVDILSKNNIDYGQIPDSQGILTKYKGYELMSKSMESLNKLFEGIPCDEIKLMNKLHDVIIACKKDYEFGYKFDIEIIKISYCAAVLSLYEMINVCIVKYTKKMKKDAGITFNVKTSKSKDPLVIRGTKSIIKAYENGQWSKMITALKKDPHIMGDAVVAKEAFFSPIKGGDILKNVVSNSNGAGNLGEAIKGAGNWMNGHPALKVGAIVIASIIAVLVGVRLLVYTFYNAANSIKDNIRTQKDFVDFAVDQEKEDGTSQKTIDKHQKFANKLEGIANFIEVRILKTDSDAKKDMKKSDVENFSSAEFKMANSFGGEIEF